MSNPTPNLPSGNPLEELISAKARKKLYAIFLLLGWALALAATMWAVFGALPTWLIAVTVGWNFIAGLAPALARANVTAGGDPV